MVAGQAQEQWASVAKDYAALQAGGILRIEAIHRYKVPVLALDALELGDVSAIKLDAEGAEEEILRGAAATLTRCQPVCPWRSRNATEPAVHAPGAELLVGLGYEGWYEFYGDWRPIAGFNSAAMQRASPSPACFEVSDPYVFCFYFVPPERRAELAALARLP